jgi:hypothetical protein
VMDRFRDAEVHDVKTAGLLRRISSVRSVKKITADVSVSDRCVESAPCSQGQPCVCNGMWSAIDVNALRQAFVERI